jgi:phenylacetate-CoA ligase
MDDENKKYFNMDIEPLLNTPEMRKIQESKLASTMRFFYDKVPFDRERMDQAGVKPEDIKTLKDLATAVPIAGQADYRKVFDLFDNDMAKSYEHLFGKQRMDDMYLLTTTSGTTGIPTPYPVFHKTTEAMGELFGRIGWRCNFRAGDRLAVGFGLSMHAAGTPHLLWYRRIKGLTIIPIGAEVGTERLLNFIKLFKANILSCTPSLATYLIEKSEEVLGESVKSLGIKTLMCGAEPGAGIPEVRNRLESEFGANLYDVGAGYGISCNHPEYQGMHWVADDYCHYELVDPKTHEPVPMAHGATGLAVFTPLEPESTIFMHNLRFTLNDIHQVFTEPCPCGSSGFRYKIVGRADDMLKVKGVPVYPAAIQGVINGFIPRLTGAFRIVLEVPPPRVIPPLKLRVEYGEGVGEGELPALEKEIMEKMHTINKIKPEIAWLAPNTLERAVKKTQFLEKAYEEK